MKIIKSKYRAWKKNNPCLDRQYDEINEFVAGLSRGEIMMIMEYLDNTLQQEEPNHDGQKRVSK